MGHITAAVAALFMILVSSVVTIKMKPRITGGLLSRSTTNADSTIKSAAPVVSIARAIGINAANSTTTDQSMFSYTCRSGITRNAITANIPAAKATAAEVMPVAAKATAATMIIEANAARFLLGTRTVRSANGTQL